MLSRIVPQGENVGALAAAALQLHPTLDEPGQQAAAEAAALGVGPRGFREGAQGLSHGDP
jgi:hypothetical protein